MSYSSLHFNPYTGLAGIEIGRASDLGQVYFETWRNPEIGQGEVTAKEIHGVSKSCLHQ